MGRLSCLSNSAANRGHCSSNQPTQQGPMTTRGSDGSSTSRLTCSWCRNLFFSFFLSGGDHEKQLWDVVVQTRFSVLVSQVDSLWLLQGRLDPDTVIDQRPSGRERESCSQSDAQQHLWGSGHDGKIKTSCLQSGKFPPWKFSERPRSGSCRCCTDCCLKQEMMIRVVRFRVLVKPLVRRHDGCLPVIPDSTSTL